MARRIGRQPRRGRPSKRLQKMTEEMELMLGDPSVVIVDTETTGLASNDEVIELSVIDTLGNVLFDRRFKPSPQTSIKASASAIHGITHRDVAECDMFSEYAEQVAGLLEGKTVVAYNASFDKRVLIQTARASRNIEAIRFFGHSMKVYCMMESHSEAYGGQNSRYQSLQKAILQRRIPRAATLYKYAHKGLVDVGLVLLLMASYAPQYTEDVWGSMTDLSNHVLGVMVNG